MRASGNRVPARARGGNMGHKPHSEVGRHARDQDKPNQSRVRKQCGSKHGQHDAPTSRTRRTYGPEQQGAIAGAGGDHRPPTVTPATANEAEPPHPRDRVGRPCAGAPSSTARHGARTRLHKHHLAPPSHHAPATQRPPHGRRPRRTANAKHHTRRTPRRGTVPNILAPVTQGHERVLDGRKDAAHGGVDEAGAANHAQRLQGGRWERKSQGAREGGG